jgi:hypothetical protein
MKLPWCNHNHHTEGHQVSPQYPSETAHPICYKSLSDVTDVFIGQFDTLYFQIICSKKRKSTDQRETLCHLNNNGNISLNTSFISYGKLSNSTFTCQSYDQLTSFLTIKIFSLTTFSQIREINR